MGKSSNTVNGLIFNNSNKINFKKSVAHLNISRHSLEKINENDFAAFNL